VTTPTGTRRSEAVSSGRGSERPEPFSTYLPRQLVRRLKVLSAIQDLPMWVVVSQALEDYVGAFEGRHGPLPNLVERPDSSRSERR